MTYRLTRKQVRAALVVFVVGGVLAAVGIVAYAEHLRSSATALINSARDIRTTADAEREITALGKQFGHQFWQESDHLGGDHNYNAQIENVLLSRLGVVEPTNISLGVTMNDGKLRCITLVMFTGRPPRTPSGVRIQEWFNSDSVSNFHVSAKDKPWKAAIEFTSAIPDVQREKAFLLNTKCFVQLGGCKSAQDILPTVWQLGAPLGSNLGQGGTDDKF